MPLKMFYRIDDDRLSKNFKKLLGNALRMHSFTNAASKYQNVVHAILSFVKL